MQKKILNPNLVFDLIQAFRSVNSAEESAEFIQDVLTANEIRNLSVRLRIARLLLKGVPQRQIAIESNVSIVTVTKVNSWLNQKGEGFKKVIARLPHKYKPPTKTIRGPIEYHLPEVIAGTAEIIIANQQIKSANKVVETVKNKEDSDKNLRKIYSDYTKH